MRLKYSEKFFVMAKKKLSYKLNWAENLEYMSCLESETIDFIYIDPPFNTSKIQKRKQRKPTKEWAKFVVDLQYYDSFGDGTNGYLQFMKPRLEHCHRLLNDKGVLCVHLDYRSVHYIKCMLDEIFGYGDIDRGKDNHFINEIVWHYKKWSNSPKSFQKNHDTILVYSKSDNYKFNTLYQDYANKKWIENTVRTRDKTGKLVRAKDKHGNYKKRKKENKGVPMHDVFNDIEDLDFIEEAHKSNVIDDISWGATNKERLNYPTQKPVALVARLIEVFTNKGDIVADFFCGCATTLEASMNLERSFIGCDGQDKVLSVLDERISKRQHMKKHKIQAESPFSKIPKSFNKMNHKDYERKTILCVGGVPNAVQTSDGGWDGTRISDGALIQAKKHKSKIGRPDLQKFVGTMVYRGKKKGVFISHTGFSQEARDFVSDLRKDGYIIELRTSHYLKKLAELKEKEFRDFNIRMQKAS